MLIGILEVNDFFFQKKKAHKKGNAIGTGKSHFYA